MPNEYCRTARASEPAFKTHDLLTAVNDDPVRHLSDLERELYRTGSYAKAYYTITRDGIELDTPVMVIPEPVDRSLRLALRIIGLIYLAIGLYVLFRRWTAPRATHFYLFCLVSFALYALKYTGQARRAGLDRLLAQRVAESLQPALFLHFALSFPEERLKTRAPRAGCCRWSTRPARLCWACGSGRSITGRPPDC